MSSKNNFINHMKEYLILYLLVVIAIVLSINTSYAVDNYTYNIEFDLNGGVGRENYDYSTRKINTQEYFNVGDPIKDDYIFIGWKIENYDKDNAYIHNIDYIKNGYYDSSKQKWLDDPEYINILLRNMGKSNQTVKFIAQYKKINSYNIEFDLNGGIGDEEGDYSKRTIKDEETFVVNNPHREGFIFVGWKLINYNADTTTITWPVNTKLKNSGYNETYGKWLFYVEYSGFYIKNLGKANETVKLQAQWKVPHSYNVEFNLDGGIGDEDSNYSKKTMLEGTYLSVTNPTKEGYIFDGWKITNHNPEEAYIGGTIHKYYRDVPKVYEPQRNYVILVNLGNPNTTVTLTAQWKKPYKYTVEFNLNGGIGRAGYDYNTRQIESYKHFEIGEPTKEGYRFIGWKLENYDEENAYIAVNGTYEYVKGDCYDEQNNKYLMDKNYANIFVQNMGRANEKVRFIAQWKKVNPELISDTTSNDSKNDAPTNNPPTNNSTENNMPTNNNSQQSSNNNPQQNNNQQQNNEQQQNNNEQNNNTQPDVKPEASAPSDETSDKTSDKTSDDTNKKEEIDPIVLTIIATATVVILIGIGMGISKITQNNDKNKIQKSKNESE